MANEDQDKAAADKAAADKEAADTAAKAAADAATAKPNDNVRDNKPATDESPPKANPGVEAKPAADSNPRASFEQGAGNLLNTDGLTPAQRARVNGTPIDGAHGAAVLGIAAVNPRGEGTAPFRPAESDTAEGIAKANARREASAIKARNK